MKLLWKEWRQQKWIALFGLFVGVLFPAFDCLFQLNQRRIYFATEAGSYFLLFTGAAYAVILAIASMHHDTRKGVDAFLLSKPVNLRRFYASKFILAAFLLGVVFLGTISIDIVTYLQIDRSSKWENISVILAILHYTYPVALLLFAAGVFYMTVVRDTARAAFLAIWTALLLYFLPLVVAQLHWMSIFEQLENPHNSLAYHLLTRYPYREQSFLVWLSEALSGYQWRHFAGYLSFLAVMLAGAIVFVALSVKAERYHWRWRPHQKSIVWTMGVSAAVIFALALLQVGHNLKPAEEFNGKPLVNPVHYDWSEHIDPLEEKYLLSMSYRSEGGHLCVKDEMMFQVVVGYQADHIKKIYNAPDGCSHFILQVNRFPYVQNPGSDTEDGLAPDLLAGATRFFQTEPGADVWRQSIIGSYLRNDRLYTAYRPRHIRGPDAEDKNHYPGSLNPMYLVTFDISEPTRPTVLSNMEISRSNVLYPTMGGADDFCYIDDGPQLIVISLKEPDNPRVIRRIDIDDEDVFSTAIGRKSPEQESKRWTPQRRLMIGQDRLVYSDYHRIRIMDISDRLNPRTIYDKTMYGRYLNDDILATYYQGGRLYTATNNGIYIFELQPDNDGVYTSRLIGHRRATTLEKLSGRNPKALLLRDNLLIEQAGGFGILVYDVSNPSMPRRSYHAQAGGYGYWSRIGFWMGLLYVMDYNNKLFLYELPKITDDSQE